MSSETTPGRDPLEELAGRLAEWRPAAPGIDRDRVLYEAGRASAGWGRTSAWRSWGLSAVAATALLVALVEGYVLRVQAEGSRRMLAAQAASAAGQERTIAGLRTEVERLRVAAAGIPERGLARAIERGPLDGSSYLVLSRRLTGGDMAGRMEEPGDRGSRGVDDAGGRDVLRAGDLERFDL
jgi:hypothetical protein